jgi:hypothetical protein
MSGKIDISQNTGTVTFGNVVQGDHNKVGDLVTSAAIDSAVQGACEKIRGVAASRGLAESVIMQVRALSQEAKQEDPDQRKGSSIVKAIRDNFSWAYPIVKDLVSVVWPALLLMI